MEDYAAGSICLGLQTEQMESQNMELTTMRKPLACIVGWLTTLPKGNILNKGCAAGLLLSA